MRNIYVFCVDNQGGDDSSGPGASQDPEVEAFRAEVGRAMKHLLTLTVAAAAYKGQC